MSFFDIEKLIGSPMQTPIDLKSGDEYYHMSNNDVYADDELSDIDENSYDSIEYCDPDDACEQQPQEYYYQSIQLEEKFQQQQKEIQQQQDEQYKKIIERLRFMSLNEQQIMLYHGDSNHCIIQMES